MQKKLWTRREKPNLATFNTKFGKYQFSLQNTSCNLLLSFPINKIYILILSKVVEQLEFVN